MHLITRRSAPTHVGPKVDDSRDRLLCRSMLDEIRSIAGQAKARIRQAEHASSRLTLETVALLCASAVEALEKHLEIGAHPKPIPNATKSSPKTQQAGPDTAKEPLPPEELEWRPGERTALG